MTSASKSCNTSDDELAHLVRQLRGVLAGFEQDGRATSVAGEQLLSERLSSTSSPTRGENADHLPVGPNRSTGPRAAGVVPLPERGSHHGSSVQEEARGPQEPRRLFSPPARPVFPSSHYQFPEHWMQQKRKGARRRRAPGGDHRETYVPDQRMGLLSQKGAEHLRRGRKKPGVEGSDRVDGEGESSQLSLGSEGVEPAGLHDERNTTSEKDLVQHVPTTSLFNGGVAREEAAARREALRETLQKMLSGQREGGRDDCSDGDSDNSSGEEEGENFSPQEGGTTLAAGGTEDASASSSTTAVSPTTGSTAREIISQQGRQRGRRGRRGGRREREKLQARRQSWLQYHEHDWMHGSAAWSHPHSYHDQHRAARSVWGSSQHDQHGGGYGHQGWEGRGGAAAAVGARRSTNMASGQVGSSSSSSRQPRAQYEYLGNDTGHGAQRTHDSLDWQWEMGQQQRLVADLTADAKRQAASTASRMSASEADQARVQLATARQRLAALQQMQEQAFCDFNAACAQVAHATKKDQVAGRFAGAGGNRSAATRVGTTEIPMSGGYAAYPPSMARPSIIPPSGEEREYQVDEGNRNPQDFLRGNRTNNEPFSYTGGGGDCPSQNSKTAEEVGSPGNKSSKPKASDVIQKLYLAAMKQKEKAEHVEAGGGDAARAPPGL